MATSQEATPSGVEKCGYLMIKRPPHCGKVRIKAWQSKYFILRHTPAVLDYYKDEISAHSPKAEKEKYAISLDQNDVVHIGTTDASRTHQHAFIIVTNKHGALMLASDSDHTTKEWIDALNRVMQLRLSSSESSPSCLQRCLEKEVLLSPSPRDSPVMSPGEGRLKNEPGDSTSQGFPVTSRFTPTAEKNSLRGPYLMVITDKHVTLHRDGSPSGNPVVSWSLTSLRGWKCDPAETPGDAGKQLLTLESGRKSLTGEGVFQFFTSHGDQIYEMIRTRSNALFASAVGKSEWFQHERSCSFENLPTASSPTKLPRVQTLNEPRLLARRNQVKTQRGSSMIARKRSDSDSSLNVRAAQVRLSPASVKRDLLQDAPDVVLPGTGNDEVFVEQRRNLSSVLELGKSKEQLHENPYLDLVVDKDADPIHISDPNHRRGSSTSNMSEEEGTNHFHNKITSIDETTDEPMLYVDDRRRKAPQQPKPKPTNNRFTFDDYGNVNEKDGYQPYSDPDLLRRENCVKDAMQTSDAQKKLTEDFFAQLANPTAHKTAVFPTKSLSIKSSTYSAAIASKRELKTESSSYPKETASKREQTTESSTYSAAIASKRELKTESSSYPKETASKREQKTVSSTYSEAVASQREQKTESSSYPKETASKREQKTESSTYSAAIASKREQNTVSSSYPKETASKREQNTESSTSPKTIVSKLEQSTLEQKLVKESFQESSNNVTETFQFACKTQTPPSMPVSTSSSFPKDGISYNDDGPMIMDEMKRASTNASQDLKEIKEGPRVGERNLEKHFSESKDSESEGFPQDVVSAKSEMRDESVETPGNDMEGLLQKVISQMETPMQAESGQLLFAMPKRNSTGSVCTDNLNKDKHKQLGPKSHTLGAELGVKKQIEKSKSHCGFEIRANQDRPPPLPVRPELSVNGPARTRSSSSMGDIFEGMHRRSDGVGLDKGKTFFAKGINMPHASPPGHNWSPLSAACGPESHHATRLLMRSSTANQIPSEVISSPPSTRDSPDGLRSPGPGVEMERPRSSSLRGCSDERPTDYERSPEDDENKKRRGSNKASKVISRILNSMSLSPKPGRRASYDSYPSEGSREFEDFYKVRTGSLTPGIINEGWSPDTSSDMLPSEGSPKLSVKGFGARVRRRASHDGTPDLNEFATGNPTPDEKTIEEQRQRARTRERERAELPDAHEPPPALPPRKKSEPPPLPPRRKKSPSEDSPSPVTHQRKSSGDHRGSPLVRKPSGGTTYPTGKSFQFENTPPPPVPPRRDERRGSQTPAIQLTKSSPEYELDRPEKDFVGRDRAFSESPTSARRRSSGDVVTCLPTMSCQPNTDEHVSSPVPKRPPKSKQLWARQHPVEKHPDSSSGDELPYIGRLDPEGQHEPPYIGRVDTEWQHGPPYIGQVDTEAHHGPPYELPNIGRVDSDGQHGGHAKHGKQLRRMEHIEQRSAFSSLASTSGGLSDHDVVVTSEEATTHMRVGDILDNDIDDLCPVVESEEKWKKSYCVDDEKTNNLELRPRSASPMPTGLMPGLEPLARKLSAGNIRTTSARSESSWHGAGHTPPMPPKIPKHGGVLVRNDSSPTTPISV